MFKEEAMWINAVLSGVCINVPGKVLDVGSSNLEFRTITQRHIHELVHKPLQAKGLDINFLDIKRGEGVDIETDLTSNNLPDSLFTSTYDLIIFCNILEHVSQRETFIRNLLKFSHPGTLLMVTAPLVYPKHNDPIDTMYRPTVRDLTNLIGSLSKCRVIESKELVITDKEYYVLEPGRLMDYLFLRSLRWTIRFYVRQFRWKVTCLLLKVKDR